MQFGHFDDAKKEYVITSPKTPLPWINYLGSENFFSLISNTCGGYSFYKDAKLLRLTRYRYNDTPLDQNGRYYYIKDGDTVRVWTKHGEVLRHACCMENMIPGEVGIPHGSWVRVNEKTGIDEGGADNYLTGNEISGGGLTSYNNNNCNFEKYDGPALEADCYTDRRIIEVD